MKKSNQYQKPIINILSIFCLYFSFIGTSSSAIFSYIEKSEGTPSNATYYYVIERWDEEIGDYPNPCYDNSRCDTIQINHKHKSNGEAGRIEEVIADRHDGIRKPKTMAGLREIILNKITLPKSGIVKHKGPPLDNNQECVGLFWGSGNHVGSWGKSQLLPGSICGIAPPPVGSCKIIEDSLDIDYKKLLVNELEGNAKTVNFSVTCNQSVDLNIIATGISSNEVVLKNDGSLVANLYLLHNGKEEAADKGIKINVSENQAAIVTLKSVLKTNGKVEPGDFRGSGFLLLTVP